MSAGRSTGQGSDDADDARCAGRRPIDRYGFVGDPQGRRLRGHRICEALAAFGGVHLPRAAILDIGCSTGLITEEIAQRAAFAVGVDVDADSIDYARRNSRRARFALAAAAELPFADGSFDAVVCNHVYEHVPDAMALMREVRRVLRPGGACYFAAGHTLQLIEPHHRLPLLSWLPRPVARAWLRHLGRADTYAEQFVAPWKLKNLFARFTDVRFISTDLLREPERFGFGGFARLPASLRQLLLTRGVLPRLAPTWIYMLRKG